MHWQDIIFCPRYRLVAGFFITSRSLFLRAGVPFSIVFFALRACIPLQLVQACIDGSEESLSSMALAQLV